MIENVVAEHLLTTNQIILETVLLTVLRNYFVRMCFELEL